MQKIVTVIIFVFVIISLNACKSTSSCSSIEKQEVNNNQTDVTLGTEVA
jgi:hypothetical protein